MPFFWVGGLVFSLLSNLQAGSCGLCEDVFDPESTLALLEQERATIAIGWPHFGKALAEHPTRASRDLSALCGGNMPGLLPPEQVPDDPELRANALGMTETCGAHTWGGEGALPESLRGSFGPAIGGFEHRIVDPASGAALPPGELGEIRVRGPRLMQALHKCEREAVFDADGWYATGDAGFFDAAGVLYFKGRLGDMIKTGGANVSPPEVEAILLAQPEVKAAQIAGIPDPDRGENVVAAVVLEDGEQVSADELKGRVAKELAAYKVPRRVFFFASTAELPQTDTGKPDKRRLRALLGERARKDAAR
jgi:acyl-CoA synthetase (AMP-forming)/AMP-acid ligase II